MSDGEDNSYVGREGVEDQVDYRTNSNKKSFDFYNTPNLSGQIRSRPLHKINPLISKYDEFGNVNRMKRRGAIGAEQAKTLKLLLKDYEPEGGAKKRAKKSTKNSAKKSTKKITKKSAKKSKKSKKSTKKTSKRK